MSMIAHNEGTIAFHADNLPAKKPLEDPYMLWHGTNNANPHDTISMVAEFEKACGATLYPLGTVPPLDKLKLRLSLELEELYEKAQAMGLEGTFQLMMEEKVNTPMCYEEDGQWYDYFPDTGKYDPVALLDACCDQRYVQDGTMLTCGLDKAFPEAFADIQASNMSKFPLTMEQAMETADDYMRKGVPVTCDFGVVDKPFVVRRRSDGKILKSKYYRPANLAPIIAKYTPTS